ncbi:MAG: Gfo/Idh/MocA family oxidoreductase [Planctomycetota bacterium]
MARKRLSRRNFLGGSLAAAATFTIVPRHVLGGPDHVAPSEKITQAVIGTGGMGMGHVHNALGDRRVELLAVCDVDAKRLEMAMGAAKKAGRPCKGYRDFRDVLARGDIDVVRIPTPPHWHALISIAAAEAGCDVWCEKPMTRSLCEGRAVRDAIKRNGRMFRINTWFRLNGDFYGFGSTVKPIKKLLSNGLLGWPVTVRVSPATGFNWKVKKNLGRTDLAPEPVPDHLDYNLWLGPAPFKPYNSARVHYRFRAYWDYDNGGLGDMAQHHLDPVQYILGKDNESPIEVHANAPWPQHPDAVGYWERVEMKYADGCRIILESGEYGKMESEGQPYIEGPKGRLYKGFRLDPPELAEALEACPEPEPMVSDFMVSVLTRQRFGLNEDTCMRSNILTHLASIAIRTGRKLRFDPETQRFIGDEEANRLACPPMRAPWHV